MKHIFVKFFTLVLFILIGNLDVISGFNNNPLVTTQIKGDLGQIYSNFMDKGLSKVVKRETYRYYGTGSKGSSSLLPTSPSKPQNHFYADDAYGYKTEERVPNKNTVQNSLANYLQFYETAESLPMDFGEMAAASGHGHGHSSGYGHGGGGGHGKGCNSALGLLGVLGLAAYLQSVLQQMNNATGRRRRRRGVEEEVIKMTDSEIKEFFGNNTSKADNVMKGLLPALSAVAHARDGLVPINCTYRHICNANAFLVETVGSVGRSVGALLSSEIGKLLIEVDRRRGPIILKSINKVAQLGRSGYDCDNLFQDCETLSYLPSYSMPPTSRFSKIPHHLLKHSGEQIHRSKLKNLQEQKKSNKQDDM